MKISSDRYYEYSDQRQSRIQEAVNTPHNPTTDEETTLKDEFNPRDINDDQRQVIKTTRYTIVEQIEADDKTYYYINYEDEQAAHSKTQMRQLGYGLGKAYGMSPPAHAFGDSWTVSRPADGTDEFNINSIIEDDLIDEYITTIAKNMAVINWDIDNDLFISPEDGHIHNIDISPRTHSPIDAKYRLIRRPIHRLDMKLGTDEYTQLELLTIIELRALDMIKYLFNNQDQLHEHIEDDDQRSKYLRSLQPLVNTLPNFHGLSEPEFLPQTIRPQTVQHWEDPQSMLE